VLFRSLKYNYTNKSSKIMLKLIKNERRTNAEVDSLIDTEI
jgi:hypothetical protein